MSKYNTKKVIRNDFCISAEILGLMPKSNIISEAELCEGSPLVLTILNVPSSPPVVDNACIEAIVYRNIHFQFTAPNYTLPSPKNMSLWFAENDNENLAIFAKAFWNNSDALDAFIYSKEHLIFLQCKLRRVPHPTQRPNIISKKNCGGTEDSTDTLDRQLRRLGL
ncbi:hypothetical protein [uncultured Alteromonas sp.]|jgi:hypothetical protein|uniref:hypothetical protein n=1 Tax=uncultured Alteromonas sp. TaxID=179113 RepID=UPI0025908388|nr:hypothetical protein [uncultured Alteromonas sp.]|tara:strand:- start:2448 stop:2945 length:498 start_codon:yes stop_codon:yes gene_type:complete